MRTSASQIVAGAGGSTGLAATATAATLADGSSTSGVGRVWADADETEPTSARPTRARTVRAMSARARLRSIRPSLYPGAIGWIKHAPPALGRNRP